jgi:cytochrome P450
MLHFLCIAKDPDTGLPAFTDKGINNEARLLLVAGSDSTTVTMSGLFFYLACYPKVHKKMVEEVTSRFSSANEITPGPKLSSCKYLRACIDEALRKAPAGLSELPREVLQGGMVIDDEYIPEGVVVGKSRYSDMNNEEVFEDPEVFRPERWIPSDDNPPEEVSHIKANFYPFSTGPFNCSGTNFALQELMLMVAKTVHRLDFRLAAGAKKKDDVPYMDLKDAYITVKEGPLLQFRRRQT